jgi:WD40 repeat protein
VSKELKAFVSRVAWSPDGKWLVGLLNEQITVLDRQTGKATRTLKSPDTCGCLALSADGRLVAAGAGTVGRGHAFVWDLAGEKGKKSAK